MLKIDCAREEFEYQRERETGRTDERIVLSSSAVGEKLWTDISQKRKRNVKGVWTNTPLPTPSLRLPSSDPVTFVPSDRLAVQSRSSP